jgi:hypothetical protein
MTYILKILSEKNLAGRHSVLTVDLEHLTAGEHSSVMKSAVLL